MTSSSSTIINGNGHHRRSHKRCCSKGNWSGMNIATMVIGFILFWPIGLLVLYWIFTGRNVKDLPGAVQDKWTNMFGSGKRGEDSSGANTVFDEFQQTQYDRITEMKEEIKNRARSFKNFRADAKRRADEAEFNEFMSADRSKEDA